jgi:hypothetical protein
VTPALHLEFEQLYAVTSHSSQGQTADRVLIHVDTELGAKGLLNNRMAYVAVSRDAYDAQIFTNDREKLGAALGHDAWHSSAHAPKMKARTEAGVACHAATGDWAKARAEPRFWLGSLREQAAVPCGPGTPRSESIMYAILDRGTR